MSPSFLYLFWDSGKVASDDVAIDYQVKIWLFSVGSDPTYKGPIARSLRIISTRVIIYSPFQL